MSKPSFSYFCDKHVIAGFGNPLLDSCAIVQGKTILQKHNLKPDGQKEVGIIEFCDLLSSLRSENYAVTYSPGGCAQNTLRVIQALVKRSSFSVFFGGLGDDEEGELLELELNKCGVETRYTKHRDYPTGRVASLINGENRSLVAHLGAAEVYRLEHFLTSENLKIIEDVYLVYIEGFFITHSFDVSLEAINVCKTHGVVVVFNISGAYVAEICPQELLAMATAADILIGNAVEFKALANVIGLNDTAPEDIALKTHSSLWKENASDKFKLSHSFGKTLVVTQGKNPVLCVCNDKKLIRFEVPYLDPKSIKDPTGAGDAFAAGFLVAFIQNKSVLECIAYGCEIAQQITQHIGVQLLNDRLT